MVETIGWGCIAAFVLAALDIVDITVYIDKHVSGEQVVCTRQAR